MQKLPVVGQCEPRGCSSCSSAGGCSSASQIPRQRVGVVALMVAVVGISLWVAIDQSGQSALGGASASTPVSASGPAGSPLPQPPATAGASLPPPPPPAGSATPVAIAAPIPAATSQPVMPIGAPPICEGWPMPHEPRGDCAGCHTVSVCTGGAQQAAAPLPTFVPVIRRTSLLPHLFAGICMNCHAILGGDPTPVNMSNLASLSPFDQKLVEAGQEVYGPSPIGEVKAPLIGREASLPHRFIGVCSNCHTVVQAGYGATPEQVEWGMKRAQKRLLALDLTPEEIAHGGQKVDMFREVMKYAFGFLALGSFLLSLVYIVMKSLLRADPKRYRGRFKMKKWFRVHEMSSYGFLVSAILHWWFSVKGNALLHASLVLVVLLSLSGIGFRYRYLRSHKKNMRWVHTQRSLMYLLIALTVLGHAVMGVD